MIGKTIKCGGFTFSLDKKVKPDFTAVMLTGYSYAYAEGFVFRIRTINDTRISGFKVKKDGSENPAVFNTDSKLTQVYAVSREGGNDATTN